MEGRNLPLQFHGTETVASHRSRRLSSAVVAFLAVPGETPILTCTKSNRVFIVVAALAVVVVVAAFISRIYTSSLQLWEIVIVLFIVIVVVVVLPSSSSLLPAGSRRSVGCWLAGWLVYFFTLF